MPEPYSPVMRPSWWPRAKGTPRVTPEVTPVVTPEVEAPQETAFQNWARRLVIGHRDVVRQILADDAAREREKFQVEREDIRAQSAERRSRENILLNIREQARVGQEKEGREREERLALSRLLGQVKTGTPPGEPPVAPEDIFQFKGGREAYQAEFPKPPSPEVFQDKQGNIRSKRTGQVLEPAPPREKFTPPEGYVPSYIETPEGDVRTHYTLPQAPYGLDAIAQGMTNPQTGKSYQRYIELPSDRKKEARDEAARLQGQFAGTRETGKTQAEEAERARQPFDRVYKDRLLVNRTTLVNETAQAPTVGMADALSLQGTHKLLSDKQARQYNSGLNALRIGKDIEEIGQRVFTATTRLGIPLRGVMMVASSWSDIGLGKDYNRLQQMKGEVMPIVLLMQQENRISDADLRVITTFMTIESPRQSAEGFLERATHVRNVFSEMLRRVVEDVTVSKDAGVTIQELLKFEKPGEGKRPGSTPGAKFKVGKKEFEVLP